MEFLNTDFLKSDEIELILEKTTDADPVKNFVPAYHFNICDKQGSEMGKCSLRVGYNENLYYGGHIGYGVDEAYRGHHYAAKACRLLFGLARKHDMKYIYITCRPDNLPSRKTCESLGGELIEIAQLPEDNYMRVSKGETETCVFKFNL